MYYFAYGSNMNLDHMRRLCGWHFNVLGMAALPEYEFGADHRGYFTIRPKKGSQVFGVLYKLDQHCLDILDDFEGYPQVFDRLNVEVESEDKDKLKAWVYVESTEEFGGTYVKENYLRMAIAGALENKLPEVWVKVLESFLPKTDGENYKGHSAGA